MEAVIKNDNGTIYAGYEFMQKKRPAGASKNAKMFTTFASTIAEKAWVFPGCIEHDDVFMGKREVRDMIGERLYELYVTKHAKIWRYGWIDVEDEEEALRYIEQQINEEMKTTFFLTK